MKTRAVSFLLALAMILTMVPAQNLQAAEPAGEQPAISTQNEEPTEEKEASFGWDLTFTSLPEGMVLPEGGYTYTYGEGLGRRPGISRRWTSPCA